ncbi:adiponectin receptor protein isoform X1 [Coccinella septempunctata]|uniref:adiponectin receptor protein isoform X1 n=1 Tax=Coccinella septempunctata TaxID=41139 RepID=UPI001D06E043|nr:adiponectin receptor protein isoform X1 [Coccinella septempunctata]XP_044762755.1 adiponectin receptor protein isoform X1 [Coccinella septempunctata]XP_044762756.1 adiponectin receptor protein isoform X1 [Coccinella septempunctata]XP_044762757.1 adiponectin receptor protein isoform X1 [Coccinella septempunctata]
MSHYSDAEDSIGESAESEGLRKRKIWDLENESLASEIKELLDDDVNSLVEEDCVGCPLPSTPEDEAILDSEMSEVLKAAVLGTGDELDITALAHNAASQAEHVVRKMIQAGWSVCHFRNLPAWLQDNDFLIFGHRPPLPSFRACFKSIFRIHTETANIWTHLLGCVAFIGIATYFLLRPQIEIEVQEKVVFGAFFVGAIICLGFSALFHTVNCHSQFVGKLFSKLDYCGIALLIMGSFVPWLYYGFYCHFRPKVVYLSIVCALGLTSIIVSLWDKFSEPEWRPFRAAVFMTFGLSGVVPAIHFGLMEGWFNHLSQKSLGWLILMGILYIIGAMMYALRVPERFFPGKFDIWLHSHQIFHVFVLGGALVHYHGISEMAMHRVTIGQCEISDTPIY